MDAQAKKVSATVNEVGEVESKVDTADYQSSAGQGQEQRAVPVQLVHKSHPSGGSGSGGGGSGILAGAVAAAAVSIQAAKDAMSGK